MSTDAPEGFGPDGFLLVAGPQLRYRPRLTNIELRGKRIGIWDQQDERWVPEWQVPRINTYAILGEG